MAEKRLALSSWERKDKHRALSRKGLGAMHNRSRIGLSMPGESFYYQSKLSKEAYWGRPPLLAGEVADARAFDKLP